MVEAIVHFTAEGTVVGMVVVLLLHEFMSPSTSPVVLMAAWLAWLLCISCVFSLPIRLSNCSEVRWFDLGVSGNSS
jgi:hypothetical protein